MRWIAAFFRNTSGATAIEYGLIAALMSAALIGSYSGFSNAFNNQYISLSNTIDQPMP